MSSLKSKAQATTFLSRKLWADYLREWSVSFRVSLKNRLREFLSKSCLTWPLCTYCPLGGAKLLDKLKRQIFLLRGLWLLPLLPRDSSAEQWFRASESNEPTRQRFHPLPLETRLRSPARAC